MALGGWNPPGNEAPSNRWQLDTAKGWSPPGHGTPKAGTQFTFHDGFDPSTAQAKGFHILASPAGTSAPIDLINYTPATKEVHQPGVLAPVDQLNYSIMPPSRLRPPSAGPSGPASTPPVGVGQDDFGTSDWNRGRMTQSPALATSMPTSPLNTPAAPTQLPSSALTPRGPAARPPYMPSSSTSTDWKGMGVGADENGNEAGDPGYDPSTEDDPNVSDPYADNAGASAPAQQPPDVGGPAFGPAPVAGLAGFSGQTFPDGQHMQDWNNGKLTASWTLKPHGDPSIPADWVKDPAPTARVGQVTYEPPQQNPDGSVTQKGSNGRVLPVHAAPAAKDKWKTVTNPDGSVWQIDETTNQIHQIRAATKPSTTPTWGTEQTREDGSRYQISSTGQIRNLGTPAKNTAATQHWTTTETRSDGSLLQTNDSTGAVRVIAAPKQPQQYHVVGNRIVQTDPNNPSGQGHVVYQAPPNLNLQTDSAGNIIGVNPETGQSTLIYEDTGGETKQDLANAKARQDLIPHASLQGGDVLIPYGAEATLQDYDPQSKGSSSRHYGQMIIPPEATATAPARRNLPSSTSSKQPSTDKPAQADSSYQDQSTILAGMAAEQDHSVTTPLPAAPTPFAQSDQPEGSARSSARNQVLNSVGSPDRRDDVGAGASTKARALGTGLQTDLGTDIPSYRRRKKSKKKTFLGRGLDEFTPFVGAGQEEALDPATAYNTGQNLVGDEVRQELRMKQQEGGPPDMYGPQLRHAESPLRGDEDPELNMRMQYPQGGQSIPNRREAGAAGGWIPPNITDRISPQDLPTLHGRGQNPDAVEADFGRIGASGSRNTDVVNDIGGRTDIGGDWTPKNPAHVINSGEMQVPKPRIMLPMPSGPGQTDIGANWSPGAQGGTASALVTPGDAEQLQPWNPGMNAPRYWNEDSKVSGGQSGGALPNYKLSNTRLAFGGEPPAMNWQDHAVEQGLLGTGQAGGKFGKPTPEQGAVSPQPPQGGSPGGMPGMPPTSGPQPPTPSIPGGPGGMDGGKLSPKVMALILAILQEAKGGSPDMPGQPSSAASSGGMPGQMPPGGGSMTPLPGGMPGAGAGEPIDQGDLLSMDEFIRQAPRDYEGGLDYGRNLSSGARDMYETANRQSDAGFEDRRADIYSSGRGWEPVADTFTVAPNRYGQTREPPSQLGPGMGNRNNSSIVKDTGGQTDQGSDWIPRSGGWTPPNQGEIAAPKPRIMLPMPGGPGMTDVGGDWSPGQAGGIAAQQAHTPDDPFYPEEFTKGYVYPNTDAETSGRTGGELPPPRVGYDVQGDYKQVRAPDWAGWRKRGSLGTGQAGPTPPINPADAMGMGHKFGQPLDSGEPLHKGTDIQAVKGTPVWAPIDGVVRIENNPQGLGLQVKIVGSDGREHGLGHLASVAVQDGQHVRKGDNIGKVGSSGNTTGAHLDYRKQNMQDGNFENPEPDLGGMADMPPVPGTEMMGSGAGWQPRQPIMRIPGQMGAGGEGGMGAGAQYTVPITGPNGPGFMTVNASDPIAAAKNASQGGNQAAGTPIPGGHQAHTGEGGTAVAGPGQPGSSSSGGGGGGGGGDTIAISPAEKARLDQAQQDITQRKTNEDNRHAEQLRQLEQQAQNEADWKSVQQAIQVENTRHNTAQEQISRDQQALDMHLEQMREAQAMKMQGITSRMDILNSSLKNPWLTKLTGLTPKGGTAGMEGVGGNNIQSLIDQILGGNFGAVPSGSPGPQAPDWQTWQSWSPFQKAAWRTNTEAAGPGSFENAQAQTQQGWGNANPNVSQLAGATADAADTAGMEMTGEMFGSTPQDFWTQQNKQWSQAQAPSVKQTALAGYRNPYTVGG